MDIRTAQVLQALDGTSVQLLAELLRSPQSEKSLSEDLALRQPLVHKKLKRLNEVGLVRQKETGKRGQPWEPAAPAVTAGFLRGLLALTDALEEIDQNQRESLRQIVSEGTSPKVAWLNDRKSR